MTLQPRTHRETLARQAGNARSANGGCEVLRHFKVGLHDNFADDEVTRFTLGVLAEFHFHFVGLQFVQILPSDSSQQDADSDARLEPGRERTTTA